MQAMNNRYAFLLLALCAITWGCATTSGRTGAWRYERSIANGALPSMPPDSERSRWVTRMER